MSRPNSAASCASAAGPFELGLRTRDDHGAAEGDVGVDALAGGHLADLGDRVAHGGVLRDRGVAAGLGGQAVDRHREQRRAPPAVAAGRAEAGDLGLDARTIRSDGSSCCR